MPLVRANPNVYAAPVTRRNLADDLFDGFERLFEDVARSDGSGLAMDFYENEEALVLELAVPGVTASSIDVSVEGRQLTVRAELPSAPEGEPRRYWLRTLPARRVQPHRPSPDGGRYRAHRGPGPERPAQPAHAEGARGQGAQA
jgi:HSP20 family molecular chaperone IbpA